MRSENRLRKRKHFNYIYKNGESKSSVFVQLVFIKSKIKPFKVGFVVSKKIGKSVIRNKVKRRMREIFWEIVPNINKNYNYILIAKPGIENLDYISIKNEILMVINKAGLYEKTN